LSGWYVVKPWGDDMLDALIKCYEEDGEWAAVMKTWGDFPAKFAEVEDEIARIETDLKAAKERQEELKKGLYELMVEHNIKSYTGSRVKLSRVNPIEKETLDGKLLKKECPDIYQKYIKKTKQSGSIRITIMK
jgi:predicted phage-related endonuclease